MSNLYINLEEVKKVIALFKFRLPKDRFICLEEIESLPTIDLSEDKTSPYINREELKAFLKSRCYNQKTLTGWVELALSPTVIQEIDILPTLEDKTIQTIDEMIEILDSIYCNSSEWWEIRRTYNAMKWILQELKKRLYPNK